ncbi:hypothetical protein [Massilia sp. BKSP1R2A-1]|uniref:hypothetical protein n=1 Tax=Massilia sp. BKSP1R2A-1 TaxID=3422595 RepID=UPI003D3343C8
MNTSATPTSGALTLQQQILRRKLNDDIGKILNRRADSAIGKFAHQVATSRDWTVEEQPTSTLPSALRDMITVSQRDAGNALLEETRVLNNQYAGLSFRTVEVMLANDQDFLDLHQRAQAWATNVTRQICFTLRHRARSDPFRAFFSAYDCVVAPIDMNIVHGSDRLYSMVWETVVDLLPYQLFDALLLTPGHCTLSHGPGPAHQSTLAFARDMTAQEQQRVGTIISLYAVEPVAYLDNVVLTPLLAALRQDLTTPDLAELRRTYQDMFADLLEAYPYLLSSDRALRYMFTIPGTSCVATFSFLAPNGCARIVFCDDAESLRRGLHTNFVRGALKVGYDGIITWWMHPWRALDAVFGAEGAVILSWWLLKQVHRQLVQDFLSIEHYYLHGTDEQAALPAADNAPDETLLYVALAKTAEAAADAGDETGESVQKIDADRASNILPQLRRRYFFKLLERCGVEVAQGKGSEIKLLRKSKRPFRLGNHYGSNPTIPAFLAASILKRLDITHQDWVEAIAAG